MLEWLMLFVCVNLISVSMQTIDLKWNTDRQTVVSWTEASSAAKQQHLETLVACLSACTEAFDIHVCIS